MSDVGKYILPAILLFFIVFGLYKGVAVFEEFTEGAGEGIKTALKIFPSLLGLMVGIEMLQASGILDLLSNAVEPVGKFFGLPKEVLPLSFLKPVSGSGGIALLKNILETSGPDSDAGRVASVIAGATETTFYTITVYFGAVGIKNTRHTLPASLIADFSGIIMSGIAVKLFFS